MEETTALSSTEEFLKRCTAPQESQTDRQTDSVLQHVPYLSVYPSGCVNCLPRRIEGRKEGRQARETVPPYEYAVWQLAYPFAGIPCPFALQPDDVWVGGCVCRPSIKSPRASQPVMSRTRRRWSR